MNTIVKILEEQGLPVFWQKFVLLLALPALIFLFTNNQDLSFALILLAEQFLLVGLYFGYRSHKKTNTSRLILVSGVAIATIAISFQILIYFQAPISPIFSYLFEELGIVLIALFGYLHLYKFEKKFNLKGFSIDFSLLVVSILFLFLLVSPQLLNTIINTFSFHQVLQALNVFAGLILLSLAIIHYFLTKYFGLAEGVRMAIVICLITRFGMELVNSFGGFDNVIFINILSLSIYHIAGALSILYIFIDDLSVDFPEVSPKRVGNLFMWASSTFAIIAIPLGLIIRSTLDAPPLDLIVIGITSILTSIFVLWRFIILINNSSKQKQRLNSLIKTNHLTGLPNYQGYLEKFTLSQEKNILVNHINIQDFKAINDLYGRDVGDEVLKSLAKKLTQLPNILMAAHIHSDQFLAVFQTEESNIQELISDMQERLGKWDTLQGNSIAVPLHIGGSFNKICNAENLAKQAELALKEKTTESSSFALYIENKEDRQIPRHELRQILQESIDNSHLPVHFQPIYELNNGKLKALELLIRVNSKEHGLLTPYQFLEQAKSFGLLTSLTHVCIKMISKHIDDLCDVTININVPPYMIKSPILLQNFIQIFQAEKLEPSRFCIEITEDEDISAQELIPAVQILKEHGFTVAMDDFGTGYSSLDRLSILEVDTVKIDRNILLTADSGDKTILEWSISLAKNLGLSTVVEGVETLEQLALVKLLGADSIQGFLYSKPISIPQLNSIAINSNDIKTI